MPRLIFLQLLFQCAMAWRLRSGDESKSLLQFPESGDQEPDQQCCALHQEQTQEHGDRGEIRPQQLVSVRVRHVGKVKSKRAGIRSVGIQSNVMRKNRLQYRQDIKTK